MSANLVTAVAIPSASSRIGQAFRIEYAKVMPAHKAKPGPVTIIPSQDGESVHIGARNRRHGIHAYLNGLVARSRLCQHA